MDETARRFFLLTGLAASLFFLSLIIWTTFDSLLFGQVWLHQIPEAVGYLVLSAMLAMAGFALLRRRKAVLLFLLLAFQTLTFLPSTQGVEAASSPASFAIVPASPGQPFLEPLYQNWNSCPAPNVQSSDWNPPLGQGTCNVGYRMGNGMGEVWVYRNGTFAVANQTHGRIAPFFGTLNLARFSPVITVAVNATSKVTVLGIVSIGIGSRTLQITANFTATTTTKGVKLSLSFVKTGGGGSIPSGQSFNFSFRWPSTPVIANNAANFKFWSYNYTDMAQACVSLGCSLSQSYNGTDWRQKITLPSIATTITLDPIITNVNLNTGTIPDSQQKVFRNTRGQKAYYDIRTRTDSCNYEYSTDGVSWTVNTTDIFAVTGGAPSCSWIFREDSASSRTVIYAVAGPRFTTTATGRDIQFRIGIVPDSGTVIVFSSVQTVRASASTENQGYPTIARANDGFPHITFAYTRDGGGTGNDRKDAIVCSSQTADPTSNPVWTCSDPAITSLFPDGTGNIQTLRLMPHVQGQVTSHDVMVMDGHCNGSENLACSQHVSNSFFAFVTLDWNGATQTFGSVVTTSGTLCGSASCRGDVKTMVVNATSGRVYVAYANSTGNWSFNFDSPYSSSNFGGANLILSSPTPLAGIHLTITTGTSTKKLFVFYINPVNGDVFSKNATMTNAWSSQQTEYTNSTTDGQWVTSPYNFNETAFTSPAIPFVWVQQAATPELWFKTHSLPVGQTFSREGLHTVALDHSALRLASTFLRETLHSMTVEHLIVRFLTATREILHSESIAHTVEALRTAFGEALHNLLINHSIEKVLTGLREASHTVVMVHSVERTLTGLREVLHVATVTHIVEVSKTLVREAFHSLSVSHLFEKVFTGLKDSIHTIGIGHSGERVLTASRDLLHTLSIIHTVERQFTAVRESLHTVIMDHVGERTLTGVRDILHLLTIDHIVESVKTVGGQLVQREVSHSLSIEHLVEKVLTVGPAGGGGGIPPPHRPSIPIFLVPRVQFGLAFLLFGLVSLIFFARRIGIPFIPVPSRKVSVVVIGTLSASVVLVTWRLGYWTFPALPKVPSFRFPPLHFPQISLPDIQPSSFLAKFLSVMDNRIILATAILGIILVLVLIRKRRQS